VKAHLTMALLLTLPLPHLQGKEHPAAAYSTLVIEYAGRTDRPVFPIIITSSEKEGDWYREHLFTDVARTFTRVNVVQTSTMSNIARISLLRNGLERPTAPPDHPKAPTVRFVGGAGQRYADTILEAQTAMTVLGAIEEHVADYPDLLNDLSQIDRYLGVYLLGKGSQRTYDSSCCNQAMTLRTLVSGTERAYSKRASGYNRADVLSATARSFSKPA